MVWYGYGMVQYGMVSYGVVGTICIFWMHLNYSYSFHNHLISVHGVDCVDPECHNCTILHYKLIK